MVKGVLAGLEIPSVRQELRRHASPPAPPARGIVLERRSVPLPYPVGLSTLQLNGVHLRLVPHAPSGNATKGTGKAARAPATTAAASGEEEATVRVNVVVKVHIKGDLGDSPAQEFVAAVVPLKYTAPGYGCEGGSAAASSSSPAAQTAAARKKGAPVPPSRPDTDRKDISNKYLSTTGHLPFDKRKLNAMRREQQQQQHAQETERVEGAAGRARVVGPGEEEETSAATGKAPWLSAAVGCEAFARLDVRVQMERVRVVVELLPMVERVKRPRHAAAHGTGERKGAAGTAHALADCRLEVSVLGAVSPLV